MARWRFQGVIVPDLRSYKFLLLSLFFLSFPACLVSFEKERDHEIIFTHVYDNAVWGRNSEGVGFSGGGSLAQHAHFYMNFLQEFMKKHTIKTVVDAGCGDWEFSKYIDWEGIDYLGYDVVGHVITRNQQKHSAQNIHFVHANFLLEDLPSADLILCKHVLQHLSNADIMRFLTQLPKFKYCLITNQVDNETLTGDNADIPIGDCHKVDLSKPPFCIGNAEIYLYQSDGATHQIFFIDNSKKE